MPPTHSRRTGAFGSALAILFLVSACGGQGQSATSTPSSSTAASASVAASASAAASSGATGPAAIDAPSEVQAGVQFDVGWTGPNAQGDYVTIVAAGAAKWTDEPYFYTTGGTPGKLVAPVADGAYALWYVSGADDTILARRAIRVTPFTGALLAEDTVEAGSTFEVAWNGPNGPGDYVTIVAVGATKWTNEPYFYTNAGSPGKLVAPIAAGSYELWYVTGNSTSPQNKRPITVKPYVVTLEAPASVAAGASFEVKWTGPDGPSDYITIVPAGSPEGTYTDYKYTNTGSPVTIKAPATPGNYEVWYASDRVKGTFKSIPIRVT
jgi:Ca-activated chloride channel family protein